MSFELIASVFYGLEEQGGEWEKGVDRDASQVYMINWDRSYQNDFFTEAVKFWLRSLLFWNHSIHNMFKIWSVCIFFPRRSPRDRKKSLDEV